MRIISQDGCYDVPYEQAVVACLDRTVVAYPLNDLGSSDYIQLASYSTEEKAIKAMEMCRKKYAESEYNRIVLCGKGETIRMLKDNIAEAFKDEICDKFTFRFPADEEVE
jgi:hypothetical protein